MDTPRTLLTVTLAAILAAASFVKGNDATLIAVITMIVLCIVCSEAETFRDDEIGNPLSSRRRAEVIRFRCAIASWLAGAVAIIALLVG